MGSDRKLFQALFANSPLPKWLVDRRSLRYLAVNPAACRLYGYSEAEFLANDLSLVRPADSLETLRQDYEQLVTGKIIRIERIHRLKNGESIHVDVTAHGVEYDGVEAVMAQILDLTESRRAEQRVRDNEERLARILAASLDAVVAMDHQGTILEWSGASEAIFAWTREEAIGRRLSDLIIPPDLREAHHLGLDRYAETSERNMVGQRVEIRAVDRHGREFPVELSVSESKAGDAPIFSAFVRDLSTQKENEEARRRSEAFLQRVMETAPNLVYVFDLEQRQMSHVNGQTVPLTGYTAQEILDMGADFAKICIHPDDIKRIPNLAARLKGIADGEVVNFETRFRRKDGAWRWFANRETVFERNPDGSIRLALGFASDVTYMREANTELEIAVQKRTAELEESNRELEGFAYSISHDLRAPLRAIAATSAILMEEFYDALNADAQEMLIRQADAAGRMGKLIDELLGFTRLARAEVLPSRVDLSEAWRDAAERFGEAARRQGVTFEIEDGLYASADAGLLRQALQHLVSNAVKFSPNGGAVMIGRNEDGEFFIRDHGVGFDPRYANKLFAPFERLVREDEFPGTGIGLANVRRIIEKHGGEVRAESCLGDGATFLFHLGESIPRPHF